MSIIYELKGTGTVEARADVVKSVQNVVSSEGLM